MKGRMAWALALACAAWAAGARAQEQAALTIVPEQSELHFDARTTFHDFTGRAGRPVGRCTVAGGKVIDGVVQIDAAAIRTGNGDRDHDMQKPEYLDVARYPTITFDVSGYEGPPVAPGNVADGTLRGTLHVKSTALADVRVPVRWSWDQQALRVEGQFPLDIRQLGMKPPQVFLVQKMEPVVQVHLRLAFAPRAGAPVGRTPPPPR